MALLTPASISELLERHDLRPSRALGQHFLADPNTARRIVRLGGVEAGDRVLEIGPGIGSLTLALAEAGASVTALELDRHIVPVLEEVVAPASPTCGSCRATRSPSTSTRCSPRTPTCWKLVANLPYNVATPIVARVLEEAPTVDSLLVMVQREVGERLAAPAGGQDYGAISVKVAYYGRAGSRGDRCRAPSSCRHRTSTPCWCGSTATAPRRSTCRRPTRCFALVRAGFAQRRKMLRRALQAELGDRTLAVLDAAGVDPRARAESLDLDAWAALARAAA